MSQQHDPPQPPQHRHLTWTVPGAWSTIVTNDTLSRALGSSSADGWCKRALSQIAVPNLATLINLIGSVVHTVLAVLPLALHATLLLTVPASRPAHRRRSHRRQRPAADRYLALHCAVAAIPS